jgi:hypothetical protein
MARGSFITASSKSLLVDEEHMLRNGDTTYVWLNGTEIFPVSTTEWQEHPDYGMKGFSFPHGKEFIWYCIPTTHSPFLFKLPGAFSVHQSE